ASTVRGRKRGWRPPGARSPRSMRRSSRRVPTSAQVGEAKASYQQAKDELDTKSELQRRNPGTVPQRDIEKLQVVVDQRQSGVDGATAAKEIRRAAGLHPS